MDKVVYELNERIRRLEVENSRLRPKPADPESIRIQTFHWLQTEGPQKTAYLSEPDWEQHGEHVVLRGQFPVPDPVGYSQHHNMSFVIYKYYDSLEQESAIQEAVEGKMALAKPKPYGQAIIPISKEMVEAMKAFFAQTPSCADAPKLAETITIAPPYIWWYYRRKSHNIKGLPVRQARLVMALVDQIEATHAPLFNAIDDQLRRGRVSRFSIPFLFRPGEALVSSEDGIPRGYVVLTHPQRDDDKGKDEKRDLQDASKNSASWLIQCRSLEYSEEFYLVKKEVTVVLETELPDDEVDIETLCVMPVKHAAHSIQEKLTQRAKTWWKLRGKQLVSYDGSGTSGTQAVSRNNDPGELEHG